MLMPFVIFGLALGAFLNPIIDRVPLRQPLLGWPNCRSCGQRYDTMDWLAIIRVPLRGFHCSKCGSAVFARALAAEFVTAILFVLLWLRFGPSLAFILMLLYSAIFVILFFIDIEHRRVPNVVVFPAVILAMVTGFFQPGIVPAIIGGAFGFSVLMILFLVNPRGIGAGDVKLAALLGLLTGWPGVAVGLLIGFMLGGLTAFALMVFRVVGRKSYIPYAPFLIIGAVTAILYGNEIITWYLSRYQ